MYSYNFIEGNLKLAIEKYIFVYQIGMFQWFRSNKQTGIYSCAGYTGHNWAIYKRK